MGYNEMMIIVRKNSEGADLVNYFSTNFPDIPVSSNEAFFLDASTSVNLIIAAMRYLTIDEELLLGRGRNRLSTKPVWLKYTADRLCNGFGATRPERQNCARSK